jgi:peroxiredoxin
MTDLRVERRMPPLPQGTPAPDFRLPSTPEQKVGPSDFLGQPLVLAFYPLDWSPVCSDQMVLYQELLPEFRRYDAAIMGISVDSAWCHNAFAQNRNIHFPLLSDFEPKGEVSRLYNAYRTADGYSERALFVINPEGLVHWSYVSPVGVNPGADGILRSLDELASTKVLT